METTDASKIELILGDALRLLVESGASASVVGPFALKFGAKVAQRLAVPDQPASQDIRQIDLQSSIQVAVDAAVSKTLSLHLYATGTKSVRLKVGAKETLTTVSLPENLINKAIAYWGDKRVANAKIRELFERAPDDAVVKSRWLAEELRKVVSS